MDITPETEEEEETDTSSIADDISGGGVSPFNIPMGANYLESSLAVAIFTISATLAFWQKAVRKKNIIHNVESKNWY